ncbi:hypothetical protein E4U42_003369 [Claviceps africana]|uniref:Transcription factor CBF/NF-Y/archaeal histone domain-containing protein n=1 Tax=Claviceps africana TaxID=83212 RepID=A0A8K0J832_9HYPO|nr:hypothetical protein E4U42_003369 [Claviceps africana]
MPYNTNAIPPRREPTGQTQLPLSRVKKIINQDSDVHMCSNNAAFVITLAAKSEESSRMGTSRLTRLQEMFIQHLAEEANTQTKLERKPRRNIQYKDIANAVSHHDNLEFLEDVVPKTMPFKKIKASAGATQSRLRGEKVPTATNGSVRAGSGGGGIAHEDTGGAAFTVPLREEEREDPNDQLEWEMRQAGGMDVRMLD